MQASRHTSCLQKGVIEISWNQRFRERTKEFLEQTGHRLVSAVSSRIKTHILDQTLQHVKQCKWFYHLAYINAQHWSLIQTIGMTVLNS